RRRGPADPRRRGEGYGFGEPNHQRPQGRAATTPTARPVGPARPSGRSKEKSVVGGLPPAESPDPALPEAVPLGAVGLPRRGRGGRRDGEPRRRTWTWPGRG